MRRDAKSAKGRPLVFLAILMAIWVAVRVITWQTQFEIQGSAGQRIAATPAGDRPVRPVATLSGAQGEVVAAPASTLVEGLDAPPPPHSQNVFVEQPVALGHETLWMAASQRGVATEAPSGGN